MRPKSILIVEDQFVTTLELKEMLEANHYEVVATADSGPEGVAMARKHKPDLILMDIRMPGEMDGIQAARILRRDLDIPSIFLTGHDKPELIRRAREANPLGYILKPLHQGQIVAALEVAFEEREKEIQFRKYRKRTEELLSSSVVYVSPTDNTCGNNSPCYATIQEAINEASTGAVIKVCEGAYNETPVLNQSKHITLNGCWNPSFTGQTPGKTRIKAPKAPLGSISLRMVTIKP